MSHSASDDLGRRRKQAVQMRLAGHTLPEIRAATGLSAPTIIGAHKAFVAGGWGAISRRAPGRSPGQGRSLDAALEQAAGDAAFGGPPDGAPLWSPEILQGWLGRQRSGAGLGAAALRRLLARWGLAFAPLRRQAAAAGQGGWWDAATRQPRGGARLWWVGTHHAEGGRPLIVALSSRGALRWLPVADLHAQARHIEFLTHLLGESDTPLRVLHHGLALERADELRAWAAAKAPRLVLEACPFGLAGAVPAPSPVPARKPAPPIVKDRTASMNLTHLQRLEAESIHILREVVAECDKPVMLYSVGKDSAVMLRLAQKAFFPAPPPFPLLHVDTTWKFRDMYTMRERMARELGMELLVYRNPEAERLGINPFDHGSQIHTDMWKTQGLKQALDQYGFDAAFGGARRDEEKSRAKERIFSFRSRQHRWDPKQQRPELWHLYNTRKHKGESMRVFPLSNWTELDVWQYIHLENIPIVPLYFAKERPVVERDGALIMVDDERMPLEPGEVPLMRKVRFRTLGCYPLTGGVASDADTLPAIIQEMLLTRTSERQGRVIDHDQAASMEKKKQEGYF
jgi:sulfate adenylyltransferase subunit 2